MEVEIIYQKFSKKMDHLLILKGMACYAFPVVTAFQIRTFHRMCAWKLPKNFQSSNTLLHLGMSQNWKFIFAFVQELLKFFGGGGGSGE